jgi:GcrA cell cycle regulator
MDIEISIDRHRWTEPQDAHLKRCIVERGLSYTQAAAEISAAFKIHLSRNAAIGRGARIGITKPRTVKPAKLSAPTPHALPRPRRVKKPQPQLPDIPSPAIEPDEPEAIDLPGGAPALITVLDLKAHHCRYPIGEGPFHFCGMSKLDGIPYCAAHARIAFRGDERRTA